MLRTQTSDSPWECDSCKNRPTKTLHDNRKLVMIDIDENDLEFELYHLCRDCAEKLHKQLGDILGHTPKEIEAVSRLDSVEKFIDESNFIEVILPDGIVIRANKFGEDLEDE